MNAAALPKTVIDRSFNWGAFFLTWIWAIFNRSVDKVTVVLLILCVVPYIGFISAIALALYSGITGNRRSLANKEWRDHRHFVMVQKRWAVFGVSQFFLAIVILTLVPLFYDK